MSFARRPRKRGMLSSSLQKRDVIKLTAERWELKRFLVDHVTPKSKHPAWILEPKSGTVSSFSPPPPFDSTVDMDPRLVVAMSDLPIDVYISALVPRFGGECELVGLNDKNALAIFSNPARAAAALRRLNHGCPHHGALVAQDPGTSAHGNNAWGLGTVPKDGCLGAKGSESWNQWKKPLFLESDSWGGDDWSSTVADAAVPVWTVNEVATFSATNQWHILEQDTTKNLVASESKEEGSSAVKSGFGGISSAGQDVGTSKAPMHEEIG